MRDLKGPNAWVTWAQNDTHCISALILCQSLRRVFTTQKIIVLVTRDISNAMRELLEGQFDCVMKIDMDDAIEKNLPIEVFVKLFCWQLTIFKKCVYLESDVLVLENCDDIFYYNDFSSTLDTSAFVFEPSFNTYSRLLQSLIEYKGDMSEFLGKHISYLRTSDKINELPTPEYNAEINVSSSIDEYSCAVKTVRFTELKPWMCSQNSTNVQKTGQKLIGQYYEVLSQVWMNIFLEDVAPHLVFEMNLPQELQESIPTNHHNGPYNRSYTSKYLNQSLTDSTAVIGLSCRFPGANSPEEFWDLLYNGRDAVCKVPIGRWDSKDVEMDEEDLSKTKAGFLKCPIDEFDAKFFGISPREAGFMDPQQRLLLEVAWESLENAGINPFSLKDSNTGVFTGIWTGDYEAMLRKNIKGNQAHRVYLGNAYSATSARISFFLGLVGPNIATESGCSSSFVSLHLACESLQKGECNLALSGGVNLLLHPYSLVGSGRPYFMSADGHCKAFDAKADGFGRAEGCGMVVLKRFSDAIRDGDRILGVVKGSAVNSEGTTPSFGTPSKVCQTLVIKNALEIANVEPSKVSYIEAHGTGTTVGDPIEILALTEAYSPGRQSPLIIGSVKTNIAHAEGAAGIAGLIKVLLSLQHETIPPHANFESLNPDIDLKLIPALIPFQPMKWTKHKNETRIAGISSFGISGSNVHVIVEEPPIVRAGSLLPNFFNRSQHILTLSAKNTHALEEMVKKYVQYMANNPSELISDISFTANTGRAHFVHRLAVIGRDTDEVKFNLENKIYTSGKSPSSKPTIAFLFTGQGCQYPRMSMSLYESHPVFKNSMNRCEEILQNNFGISVLDAIWMDALPSGSNNDTIINETIYSQISIFCVQYSLLQLWKSFGVNSDYVLGHSVGEFAAATAAGILHLEDAIKLVFERSKLIQTLPPGKMLVVKVCLQTAKLLLKNFVNIHRELWLDIAVINSSDEIVVAGRQNAIEMFAEMCSISGVKTQQLAATHAFHSRDMHSILERFGKIADNIKYRNSTCQYVSGRDGKLKSKKDLNSNYWQSHARDTVNFTLGIKTLFDSGCRVFLEIGPHPVLLALALSNLSAESAKEAIWLPTIRRNEEEWKTIISSLGKLYSNVMDINWKNFDSAYKRKKVVLPTYPFQRQKYWFESTTEPNSLTCNTRILHPLLGKKVPVATGDMQVHIYQLSLLLEDLPYLQDHQVANKIIMPCAGFLEIILAAGSLVVQTNQCNFVHHNHPFIIQEFSIEAPLELVLEKPCRLQTIVRPSNDTNQSEVLHISVYKNTEASNGGWKRHVTAKFITGVNSIPPIYSQGENLSELKLRCNLEISTEEMYKKISEVGIFFGPTFQSIIKFWKGDNEVLAEVLSPHLTYDTKSYICHPIVLDAMLQAYAFQVDLDKFALHLPITIEKFVWFSLNNTDKFFLHISWEDLDSQRHGLVKLLNENGEVLGAMEGVRLVKTSVSAFISFLNAQKREVPGLYQEVFRPKVGPFMSRIDLLSLPDTNTVDINLVEYFTELRENMDPSRYELEDRLCYYYLINTLYDLGWQPIVGKILNTRELMNSLLISFRHKRFIDRVLNVLAEEGVLKSQQVSQDQKLDAWEIIKLPIMRSQLQQHISDNRQSIMDMSEIFPMQLPILQHCAENLAAVLQDTESALAVLFPENEPEKSAVQIYLHAEYCVQTNLAFQKICETIFSNNEESSSGSVRILEVGGGIGSTTDYVFSAFEKMGVQFNYTFTDISPLFLSQAAEKFSDVNRVTYKVLNIEKDPKSQGFAPHQYDLVIASNVLHATADIKASMKNIRHLLAPSGYLLNFEMFKPIRPIDFVFGVLEGFWRYTDVDLRPSHPFISTKSWEQIAYETDFESVKCLPTWNNAVGVVIAQAGNENTKYDNTIGDNPTWLIFGDKYNLITTSLIEKLTTDGITAVLVTQGESFLEINSNEFTVNPVFISDFEALFSCDSLRELTIKGIVFLWGIHVTEKHQDNICGALLHLSQCLVQEFITSLCKLFVVTKGMYYTGDETPMNPTAAILRGAVLSLKSEQSRFKCVCVDFDPDELAEDIAISELYHELWTNESEYQVVMRDRKRFVVRLIAVSPPPASLTFPKSERYKLILPESKSINDLILSYVYSVDIPPKHVEVSVRAVGLNFRDLLVIMKPEMYNTLFDDVGMEFSGLVTAIGSEVIKYKVGDNVFGFSTSGAVSSNTITSESMVMRKPESVTHSEAATMPIAFFTAYHCLIQVAKMKSTHSVLIHVASGGVGLAAIQICRQIGSKIIATAGSRRKKAYLRSLGIEFVFHSRNTSYADEIMTASNGVGVDIVLNSLTGPNFKESTLHVCKKGAHFIEMSKINIWQKDQVTLLRPDVTYTIVNLETELGNQNLSAEIENLILNGSYKPLPYTKFDVTQIIEAFSYLQQAGHIGKVVVTMPNITHSKGHLQVTEDMFNCNSTYLITGGLGGIGLEVAKFIASSGGKCIFLIGRNPPSTSAAEVIKSLISKGIQVYTKQVDVGDIEQCKELLRTIQNSEMNLPPLRGIMHTAGCLSDGMMRNQTMSKYDIVFNAKVKGTWNLHNLTQQYNLEHFVLFSSAAAILGPMGQSNHAAANSFMDTFAHYRHALGLPIQTINWGIWSEIGAAAEMSLGKEGAFGIKPFSPTQGIAALKMAMKYHYLQIVVSEIDLNQFKEDILNLGALIEELTTNASSEVSSEMVAEGEKVWKEIIGVKSEQRPHAIKLHIETMIRQTLKLPQDEVLDENQNFSDMGLDSLMAVEMRNKLQLIFGKNLTLNTTALLDNPSIKALSWYLAKLVCSKEESINSCQEIPNLNHNLIHSDTEIESIQISMPPEDPEVSLRFDLVKKDTILPLHITAASKSTKPSAFRNILITGATGQLGIFILSELSQKNYLNIYCLIRGKTEMDSKKRLLLKLKKVGLLHCTTMLNIFCLTGNIVDERMGLSSSKYDELAGQIDAVIHCAVKANHIEEYKLQNGMKGSDIRSVNVQGTKNVLEFAAKSKTKHVLHASSLVAITKATNDGCFTENLPSDDDFGNGIKWGYALSKFVGEKLVKQAIERSIPIRVLRFPTIVGHSETGQFALESNHLMLFLFGCMSLSVCPSLDGAWSSIPVDLAAGISVKILFDDNAESGAYNINNPLVVTQADLNEMAKEKGYTVRIVPEAEWIDALKSKGEDSLLYPLKALYLRKDGLSSFISSSPASQMAFSNKIGVKLFGMSPKLLKYFPGIDKTIPHSKDICKRHLDYAEKVGWFRMFDMF